MGQPEQQDLECRGAAKVVGLKHSTEIKVKPKETSRSFIIWGLWEILRKEGDSRGKTGEI